MTVEFGQDDVRELEVIRDEPGALQQIVAAEVDIAISTAKRFPRSLDLAQKQLRDVVTMDQEAAEECTYALKRGSKPITGPSVRFAEAVAIAWGNTKYGARIMSIGEREVEAQGVFHDLERNVLVTKTAKRRITYKDGSRFNDDMIAVTCNAASSIALRNAILAGVPKTFWRPAWLSSQQVARGTEKTLVRRRQDAMQALRQLGVSNDRIFAAVEVRGLDDVGLDELATLRQLYAGVKNGEVSLESAFPEVIDTEPSAPSSRRPAETEPDDDLPPTGDMTFGQHAVQGAGA